MPRRRLNEGVVVVVPFAEKHREPGAWFGKCVAWQKYGNRKWHVGTWSGVRLRPYAEAREEAQRLAVYVGAIEGDRASVPWKVVQVETLAEAFALARVAKHLEEAQRQEVERGQA